MMDLNIDLVMIRKRKRNRLFDPEVVDHAKVLGFMVEESSPRKTFLLMIFASLIMATFGLLNSSVAIVIGAMLVAPLLWPIMSLGMGILLMDWKMIRLSSLSVFWSVVLAIIVAVPITSLYVPLGASNDIFNLATISFMWPVAIAAGLAASFAICHEHLKESLSGVAVAVALIPPLATVGIGLGASDWNLVEKAGGVFLINLFGIILISVFVFWMMGFKSYARQAKMVVDREEKVLSAK